MTNFCKFYEVESAHEEQIAESALGVTGWAFAYVRDWSEIDVDCAMSSACQSGCVSFRTHEPNDTTADTAAAARRARVRLAVREAIGVDNLRLLTAMGALEAVIEQAEAHVITTDDADAEIFGIDSWVDTEIEITLDSGCCEHVMDLGDAPGYGSFIVESAGSKRKQNFIVGNGAKVPNEGQLVLNLEGDLGTASVASRAPFRLLK